MSRCAFLASCGLSLRQHKFVVFGATNSRCLRVYQTRRRPRVVRIPPVASLSFHVGGLRCGSCVSKCESIVQRALGGENVSVSADLLSGKVLVRFPSEKIVRSEAIAAIRIALESNGFSFEVQEPKTVGTGFESSSRLRNRFERFAPLFQSILGVFLVVGLPAFVQRLCCGPRATLEFSGRFANVVSCIFTAFYLSFPLRGMLVSGVKDMRRGSISMSALVCLSVFSQISVSLFAVLSGTFQPRFHEIALLLAVVHFGRILEGKLRMYSSTSTRKALSALQPSVCTRLRRDNADAKYVEEVVGIASASVGDVVVVKSGERFPVDGTRVSSPYSTESAILQPPALADFSVISGEASANLAVGERVWAGGVNLSEFAVFVQVSTTVSESTMATVMNMVNEALLTKSSIHRLVDSAASYLGGTALACATFVTLIYTLGQRSWLPVSLASTGPVSPFLIAASILSAACPCSLALAVPGISLVSFAAAARRGILFRNANALEVAGSATFNAIAIDKTGTLTSGNMTVSKVRMSDNAKRNGFDEGLLVQLASCLESRAAAHPIGRAIIRHSKSYGTPNLFPGAHSARVKTVPGRGIVAENVDLSLFGVRRPGTVYVGSMAWIRKLGDEEMVGCDIVDEVLEGRRCSPLDPGRTVVGVYAYELGGVLGVVELDDELRASREDVSRLRNVRGNPRVLVLSGDREVVVSHAATRLGICRDSGDLIVGDLLPVEKRNLFEDFVAGHRAGISLAVGDGVNDGPLLAAADLGFAVGRSGQGVAPVAAAASMVVIPSGGLERVREALQIGRVARFGMVGSIIWAVLYNILALIFTSGVVGVFIPAYRASLMMTCSSFISLAFPVITSAVLELRNWREKFVRERT